MSFYPLFFKAEYGAGDKIEDVTTILRKYPKNYRIVFLPYASCKKSFGSNPASGIVKQLKIQYRIDGKEGELHSGRTRRSSCPYPSRSGCA